jgi:hypothetical protein
MVVRSRRRSRWAAMGVVVVVSAGLAAAAVAVGGIAAGDDVIRACVSKRNGAVRIVSAKKRCRKGERRVTWSRRGPAGAKGANGADGVAGVRGVEGPPGAAGAPAASTVMGNTSVELLGGPAGAFATFPPSGFSADVPGGDTQVSPNATTIVRDLFVRIGSAPGPTGLRSFELLAGNRTALTCTMSGTADTCTSGEATATVAPGTDLVFRQMLVEAPAAPAPGLRWSFRALTP